MSLVIVVHGGAKVGKTHLADTAPAPRLHIDAEGGTEWLKSKRVLWNPYTHAPPEAGDWETCVVKAKDYETVERTYQWLNAGQHPFRSVTIDSLMEVQKRALDSIVGVNQPTTQDWGTLLRWVESIVRNFRDLKEHPTNPLECVVFTVGSLEKGKDTTKMQPLLQGQLGATLAYYVDVIGYLYTQPSQEGNELQRILLTEPWGNIVAGDRTGVFGTSIVNPNISSMLEQLSNAQGGL